MNHSWFIRLHHWVSFFSVWRVCVSNQCHDSQQKCVLCLQDVVLVYKYHSLPLHEMFWPLTCPVSLKASVFGAGLDQTQVFCFWEIRVGVTFREGVGKAVRRKAHLSLSLSQLSVRASHHEYQCHLLLRTKIKCFWLCHTCLWVRRERGG